jgi:hypothetical protein
MTKSSSLPACSILHILYGFQMDTVRSTLQLATMWGILFKPGVGKLPRPTAYGARGYMLS